MANWHGCPSTAAEQALCLLKRLAIVSHVIVNDCSRSRVDSEFLQPCCHLSRWRVLSPERRWDCQALLLSLIGPMTHTHCALSGFLRDPFSFVCVLSAFLMVEIAVL